MKRIGIISLYYGNSNYGGQLQSFALPFTLRKMGAQAEQISFARHFSELQPRLERLKKASLIDLPRASASLCKFVGTSLTNRILDFSLRDRLRERAYAFNQFEQLVPHSTTIYEDNSIEEAANIYDAFICGSDVIWNAGVNPRISALGFAPNDKPKVAYAPSLGVGSIPSWWFENYKTTLTRLTSISAREQSIADELSVLMPDFEISVVADPTLLLSAEEWRNVCQSQEEKKYVLCYLLGDNKEQRVKAQDTARRLSLPLLSFPHIANNHFRFCDYNFGDIQNYDANAFDFINLIRQSELVITDSFHAVVFSTIFHKPFIALDRMNGGESKMGGRVRNYLQALNLSNQLASNADDSWLGYVTQQDFSITDKRIEAMRNYSLNYLRRSLSL